MKKIVSVLLGLIALVGCTDGFKRDNPYDPKAPSGIQEPASLCGYVVSSREGAPISGAEVSIVELGRTVTTNDMGMYEFESVPAADWTIEVSVPDGLDSYLPSVRRISLEPGMVIECPPSGQEIPEVQTIVLRRRPDAPRIIDLSADDEGVVLTFSTESKLTSKRYQLHFESVFVGSDEGARPTFEESDVDIVFENDNLTIATLRPFQNGTIEALSPTNTYDLSIRVFDEDLASTYSAPVRYAHRLVFEQCAYNDDQSINNELCAPLDGTLPVESESDVIGMGSISDEILWVAESSCKIKLWATEGDYLGCVEYDISWSEGEERQCNLTADKDHVLGSNGRLVAWQASTAGVTFVYNVALSASDLNPTQCIHMDDLGADSFTLPPSRTHARAIAQENLLTLLRTTSSVALYRNELQLWERSLNDASVPPLLRSGTFNSIDVLGEQLAVNARSPGARQEVSIIEPSTGEETDLLTFAQSIAGMELLTPELIAVVLYNGDLAIFGYEATSGTLQEVTFLPADRNLFVSDVFWLPELDSNESLGRGVLAVLEKENGTINLRGLGYRRLVEGTGARWIVESKDRGFASDAFQPSKFRTIDDLKIVTNGNDVPTLLMRSLSNDGYYRMSIYRFSL